MNVRATARFLLLLAGFLACLPLFHHHEIAPAHATDRHEAFCVLTTLQKAATSTCSTPVLVAEPRITAFLPPLPELSLPAAGFPGNLSPRAPPLA